MSAELHVTKDMVDLYLKEVAKQFRKLGGKNNPAEIIIIGGASILINYSFRGMTQDIDAALRGASYMKDAINYVGDKLKLPNGWLNDDFIKTASYSPKIFQYSKHYKTFSNVLDVRTITGEYLIAMKLAAFRLYKHDISDIVGILKEHEPSDPITYERIEKALYDLYGGWERVSPDARKILNEILSKGDYEKIYRDYCKDELDARKTLLIFENDYPDVLQEHNANDILEKLRQGQKENE